GLSAYLVHAPRIGKTDGDRNMISNIHARGTPPAEAAVRLAALAAAMIEQRTSGNTLDLARLDEAAGGPGYPAPQVRPRLVNACSSNRSSQRCCRCAGYPPPIRR